MNAKSSNNPMEEIGVAKSVLSFMGTAISSISHNQDLGDFSVQDGDGFCYIMRWAEQKLETAEKLISEANDRSELEVLKTFGLPQHAHNSQQARRAWADGYAAAMKTLECLHPEMIDRLGNQQTGVTTTFETEGEQQ
jgi:hypothetical protein